MLASVLIIIVSGALFVYWFRYTCLLILSAKTARDYAQDVAAANQLSFVHVQSRLQTAYTDDCETMLDQVHEALHRDYRLVIYLLNHAATYEALKEPVEHWILRFDYQLMSLWYRATRAISGRMAREALLEMTSIVNHLANSMGERIAVSARA